MHFGRGVGFPMNPDGHRAQGWVRLSVPEARFLGPIQKVAETVAGLGRSGPITHGALMQMALACDASGVQGNVARLAQALSACLLWNPCRLLWCDDPPGPFQPGVPAGPGLTFTQLSRRGIMLDCVRLLEPGACVNRERFSAAVTTRR